MIEDREAQKPARQIEKLINELEMLVDPNVRAKVVDLIRSLMEYHAAGLERLMEIISDSPDGGRFISDECARDGLVGSLLLLYGLHPLDFETRVRKALDKVRPHLNSSGANVELHGIADGVVRLGIAQKSKGCASSEQKLRTTVEDAIYEAAPDFNAIQFEAVLEREIPRDFVPLSSLRTGKC